VLFLGVNPFDDIDDVLRYMKSRGYSVSQYNTKKTKPPHEIDAFPTLMIVNKQNTLVWKHEGYGSTFTTDKYILKKLGDLNLLK
jgi:hypothetical protein